MLKHPYAPFLWQVERPGRYIGGEFGAVTVPDSADVRIALAFPDAYEIGMSHMGLSILYEIVNKMPKMSAERVFMPWGDMESVLKKHNLPLVSLESARPLSNFDVIGFSLQYELTFSNLLAMLDLGKITRRSDNRKDDEPLVIVGGPVAISSEPIAPFVDLVLLGDGEEQLPLFLDILATCKKEGLTRKETIAKLNNMKSAYAPSFNQHKQDDISKRFIVDVKAPVASFAVVKDIDSFPSGYGPVPMVNAVFDRFSVEIARGCTQGCRFCQAGFLYRPVRERSPESIDKAIGKAVSCLGFDEASLSALSSADHSKIESVVSILGDKFTNKRVSLSVPSLRAYGLSEKLIEVLSRLRATGVTLAPEAGTQRLRDVVNKNVSEKELMSAAARFFDHGFSRIKLYFMLGLPTETDEDIEEIVNLAVRLRSLGRRRLQRKAVDIIVSVSTFVPKPFTPFERVEMIEQNEIYRRQKIVKTLGRLHRIEVKTHDSRLTKLEGIFCRGDYRLADVLEKAVDEGARFDGWGDVYNHDAWTKAFENIDTNYFLNEIPDDGKLPWSHIEAAVSEEFRIAERDKAFKDTTTRPCGRYKNEQENAAPIFVCHTCGLKCKASQMPVRPPRPKTVAYEEKPIIPKTNKFAKPKPKALAISQGEPIKYRFFLSVWGKQTFIGHLDTMRHFMRSLRRAGLEVFYTQGFHPKPKIESPPPLPLGTAGLEEPIDIWFINPPSDLEIIQKMNRSLPPDLLVKNVKRLEPNHKKLAKAFTAAKYVAFIKTDEQSAKHAVETLLAQRSIPIERTRKNKTKTIDIRPYILEATVINANPADYRVPQSQDRVCVAMTLAIPGSGGTKPAEVLASFLKEATSDIWVVRTQWIEAQ